MGDMEEIRARFSGRFAVAFLDPSCYPYTLDHRDHVPIVANHPNDIEHQEHVYTLILRRAYQNPPAELLRVFNNLFNPAIETWSMPSGLPADLDAAFETRPQTTLAEWNTAWEQQSALPKDEQGMKDELVHLQKKLDYTCVRYAAGSGMGRHAVTERYLTGYWAVDRCVAAAAGRARVRLVKRVG